MIQANQPALLFIYNSPKPQFVPIKPAAVALFQHCSSQAMQEKDNNFNPLGICHKLFNFIINTLIAKSLKRATFGRLASHGSTEESFEDSSRNGVSFMGKQPINSPSNPDEEEKLIHDHDVHGKLVENSSSKIIVEFKHRNGLEYWTPIDKLGSSVHDSGEKELPLVQGIGVCNGTFLSQVEEKTRSQEIEPISTSVVREEGLKKRISIKEGGEEIIEKEKKKEKEKSALSGRMTLVIEEGDVRKNSLRHVRPLLSVAPNINEKSDEFIRRMKEAMRKNYIHETKAS